MSVFSGIIRLGTRGHSVKVQSLSKPGCITLIMGTNFVCEYSYFRIYIFIGYKMSYNVVLSMSRWPPFFYFSLSF